MDAATTDESDEMILNKDVQDFDVHVTEFPELSSNSEYSR